MDSKYVKIRSWHVISNATSVFGKTLCGLTAKPGAETSTDLPAERSCENCLRILARMTDGGQS